MDLPITYKGFFSVEEKDMLKIRLLPKATDVVDIRSNDTWLCGTVTVEEGGNVVMDIVRAYDVYYSWGSITLERAAEIKNLVYIDKPVTESTWFGLSSKTYHPPSTRYIVDRTNDVTLSRKYVNVPVSVKVLRDD